MTKLGCLAAMLLAVASCFSTATAQSTYPSRSILFVVTAAAGGITDVSARALAQRLSESWGQQVVIENRGGAAHTAGAAAVAKATPDGYTLMVAEAGAFVINPTIYPRGKLPYDEEKDFAPISGLVLGHHSIVAANKLGIGTMAELLALAKSKPGELTYATGGIGSAGHVNIILLESMTGVKMRPVHYRGAAPALNDVIAGHIDFMSITIGLATPPAQGGQLRLLGVGSKARLEPAPNVPAIAETVPGYESSTWFGLFAPAATPREIVLKLSAETQRILADASFKEKFLSPQMLSSIAGTPDEFAALIKADTAKWSKVLREAGIKLE